MIYKKINKTETSFAHNQIKRKSLIKTGELKSNIQTVNYAWLDRGEGFNPHKHNDCEELYFFLEGKGVMKIDEKEFQVEKGDFVVVEKGEWHSVKNPFEKKLIFFTVRILI